MPSFPPSIDDLVTPVWVYDAHESKILWANESGLKLWESDSLSELCSRDFKESASQAVYETLLSLLDEIEQGKETVKWWRIVPKGIKKDVRCRFTICYTQDQRPAMLIEGTNLPEDACHRSLPSSTMVALFSHTGALLSANPVFKEAFGELASLSSWFQGSDVSATEFHLDTLRVGEVQELTLSLNTLREGLQPFRVELRCVDEADGSSGYIFSLLPV